MAGPQIHFGHNPFNLEFTGFEWAQGAIARVIGYTEQDRAGRKVIGKLHCLLAVLRFEDAVILAAQSLNDDAPCFGIRFADQHGLFSRRQRQG